MLNYIWGAMIFIGIIVAAFTGNMDKVTEAVVNGGKDAVTLAITMLGVVSVWTGLMKIAEKGGLIQVLSHKLRPILRFLFPEISENHKALSYIATNFTANFLGLGWAATPAGLAAMKELQKLNRDKKTASKSMCMFLVINMSSVQLVSVNILAYRAQYMSQSPSEILGPCLIATVVSTAAAIIAAKVMERWY